MKKVIHIINIPPINEGYELLTEFKIQRKNMKRYLSSLAIFKTQILENVQVMTKMAREFTFMKVFQSKPRKKTSKIEYFMFNGIEIYGTMAIFQEKMAVFYASLLK